MTDTPDVMTELAELPPDALVFLPAMSAYLHRHPTSVRRAVTRGELPPPFAMMGRWAWTAGAIVRHLQQRQEQAAREQAETERRIARMGP